MDFATLFWVGVGFGIVVSMLHYLTSVQVDHGPMRYERWRASFVMWSEQRSARRAAGTEAGTIPVSRYGMDAGGMEESEPPAPDMDAGNTDMSPFKRDISDAEWIAWMAVARGKDKKYRFSANAIHAAIGGDRNSVLATIRELRATPEPAEYRQPDGSTAPASRPVTGPA